MEYLKIKCHRCGNSFVLYNKDMNYAEKAPHCPHCLVKMDDKQWERLRDAFFARLIRIFGNSIWTGESHYFRSNCAWKKGMSSQQKFALINGEIL